MISIANTCIVFLSVLYIFLAPLFLTIKNFTGFSIYMPLAAIMALLSAAHLQANSPLILAAIRENSGNLLMLLFALIVVIKAPYFSEFVNLSGAIFFPFFLGAFLAFVYKEKQYFGYLLFSLVMARILIVSFFIPEMLATYPKRPEFDGRAIYLIFGSGLDVAPLMILFFFREKIRKNFVSYFSLAILIFFVAFLIVGANSRSFIALSMVITPVFTFIFIKDHALRMFGLVLYPAAVVICLFAIPGRFDHFAKIITSFMNVGSQSDLANIQDESISIRTGKIVHGFEVSNSPFFGKELRLNDDFLKGSHSWLVQIYYYFGVVGLSIFLWLNFFYVKKVLHILKLASSNLRAYSAPLLFVALFSISFFLHIFYAASFVNDPVYFLLLGLLINLDTEHLKDRTSRF